MKLTLFLQVCVLCFLSTQFFWAKGGWFDYTTVHTDVLAKHKTVDELEQRNRQVEYDIRSLKTDPQAIQERARYDLGMIKDGELFIQFES